MPAPSSALKAAAQNVTTPVREPIAEAPFSTHPIQGGAAIADIYGHESRPGNAWDSPQPPSFGIG